MRYVDRTFRNFDPAQELVAARRMTLMSREVNRGDPISGDVPVDTRRRLWMTRHVDYKGDFRPTAELETHGEGREWMDPTEDGVSVTEGENGWYTINAPWMGDEGEKVRGAEAAEARVAEVRETGDTKGIDYAHSGGGWYLITGPGVPDGLKVKGEDAAKEKVKELRASSSAELQPVEGDAAQVLVTEDGDDFLVSAPWLDAPERFADAETAEARQAQLREAGPPEGWTPSADDTTGA